MEQTILAYTAGIIDGEGTISCIKRKKEGYTWYSFRLRVHMKYNKIPYFLKSVWGGNIYHYTNRGKEEWIWQVESKECRRILKEIHLYLIEKLDQARLVFEFERILKSKQTNKLTISEKEQYLKIHDQLKALHN